LDFNFNFKLNSIREGKPNISSGHQIGHILTIFSCNLHKFSTKNWIWNQIQQDGEQNPYGGHKIGHISTIFSCNCINFEKKLEFDTKLNKLRNKNPYGDCEVTSCPSTPSPMRWLCLKAHVLLVKEKCKCISRW
jgi:hypothetical protein